MKLAPQSDAIIQRLLTKQRVTSGKLSIGPLDDASRVLLTVFVNHYEELARLKGEERVRKLRERYTIQSASVGQPSPPTNCGSSPVVPPPPVSPIVSPQWRLVTLRCTSIRGVAPPGELFEFPLDGQSCLIYGPNGSGKSSLLSAIIWVLTGATIVDTSNSVEQAPLYALPAGKTSGSKVRDWPIVVTLPNAGELIKATPACHVELLLERPSDRSRLWLRRSYGSQPQVSTDGQTWNALSDISALGIEPLDIQLSLIAPTIFGRRSIEEADNTRSILSLMLGFDDLEQLGELASQLSTNRTKLANIEKREIEAKNTALQASLRLLPGQLPEGSDSANVVQELFSIQSLTVAHCDATITQLKDAVNKAESHLAQALGLSSENGAPSGGLADRLTVAVDRLSKGFDFNFPSLSALYLNNALPATEEHTPCERLETTIADSEKCIAKAQHGDSPTLRVVAGGKCSRQQIRSVIESCSIL